MQDHYKNYYKGKINFILKKLTLINSNHMLCSQTERFYHSVITRTRHKKKYNKLKFEAKIWANHCSVPYCEDTNKACIYMYRKYLYATKYQSNNKHETDCPNKFFFYTFLYKITDISINSDGVDIKEITILHNKFLGWAN